jgi:hypothetical protein
MTRIGATHVVARLGGHLSVEDVVQELLMTLVGGESRKLAGFGEGALAAWLRISAVRTAISLGPKKLHIALAARHGRADGRTDRGPGGQRCPPRGWRWLTAGGSARPFLVWERFTA